jgi:hypothetical protein
MSTSQQVSNQADVFASLVPVLVPIFAAFVGATLTALFFFLNTEVQKRRKGSDLYRLLKAELLNLRRHCAVCSREIDALAPHDIAAIRTIRYKDGGILFLDTKEIHLMNENICQDIMQVALLSRNKDIYVDDCVDYVEQGQADIVVFKQKINNIKFRLTNLKEICDAVLGNLEKFFNDPRRYQEPMIDW